MIGPQSNRAYPDDPQPRFNRCTRPRDPGPVILTGSTFAPTCDAPLSVRFLWVTGGRVVDKIDPTPLPGMGPGVPVVTCPRCDGPAA